MSSLFLTMTKSRTKYNVEKETSKRTFGGIVFDSVMEMRYYRDVVLPGVESGRIRRYELQKSYVLQPKFTKNAKTVKAITYVADFYIQYADGHERVIDVKGMPDAVAKLKRKLFWYVYPDIDYVWVTFVAKYGGWISYEECARRRKDAKLAEKKGKIANEENCC